MYGISNYQNYTKTHKSAHNNTYKQYNDIRGLSIDTYKAINLIKPIKPLKYNNNN